ncbi:MAG: tetratricopeptide repeat protein, partial [Gammaproteobacteria bacterium]|nr:tetratricopeptide repeat protein [Gammaproteobacteria bacterium]
MPHTFRVNPDPRYTRHTAAWLPMLALTLAVTGCATTSVPSESSLPATESPVALPAPVAPPAAVQAEPASPSAISEDIDPELWYQLLVAEFASRRNQPQLAATNMLDAARQTAEPALARRATTLAIVAGNETGALDAAKLWTEVAPADNDAHQVLGTMYLALGDIDNAHGELTYLLNDPSGTRQNNLRQITGVLGRERNRANALELMRRLVDDRPDDVAAQLAYANLALRADNVTLARTILDALLLGADLDGDIALTYVAVLQREGNPS